MNLKKKKKKFWIQMISKQLPKHIFIQICVLYKYIQFGVYTSDKISE